MFEHSVGLHKYEYGRVTTLKTKIECIAFQLTRKIPFTQLKESRGKQETESIVNGKYKIRWW